MEKEVIDLDKIVFAVEPLEKVQEQIFPLLQMHYKEISAFQDIPLDPDWDRYKKMEELGILVIFTAREEGELIGYNVFFVNTNGHYKGSLQANQDVVFINPKKRGFGKLFLNWCDEQLKTLGVQVCYHHIKAKHNFGAMLESLGYELVDLIYARRLDKGETDERRIR